MSQAQETLTVEVATRTVGKALAKLVFDVKHALASGKPFEEAVAIGTAVLTDLVPAISALTSVGTDLVENKEAAFTSWALNAKDCYDAVTK